MRVAIAGAGAVGRSIAQSLLSAHHKVLLIELRRAHFRPDLVPDADWMLADATETDTLDAAGIARCDVAVAAAGDDQANLVFAFLAKSEFAVPRVVARVNDPDNQWMFTQSWGVDVAVSTPGALLTIVEEAITLGDLVRLMTLRHGSGDVVEVTLPPDAPLVGVAVGDIALPPGSAILAISRDGTLITPTPDARLQAADEVVLLTTTDVEEQIRAVMRGESRP